MMLALKVVEGEAMKLYFELLGLAIVVALPIIAIAAWGMSKLLVREPPRFWWNKKP